MTDAAPPPDDPGSAARARTADSPLVRACRREPVPFTPVWFMRQAGRALPEYRAVREGVGMLDACRRPDLVAEITMQPVRRYGVDAAILFSDIVVPLLAVGVDLDIVAGTGPVVAEPIRRADQLSVLRPPEPGDVPFLAPAIGAVTEELAGTPLIGFAGAPFTLASYLVEGGPSRDQARTKALMYGEEATWHELAGRLAVIARDFLRLQVAAGASVVQLFDSWAGALSPHDYARYVLPHSRTVLTGLADLGVPRIHFGVGTGEILGLMAQAGADVVGVDWRVPLDLAARRVGPDVALQGNLDPTVVLAPWPAVQPRVLDVLRRAEGLPGHVFNLGHGVLPQTDPDALGRIVDLVHQRSLR